VTTFRSPISGVGCRTQHGEACRSGDQRLATCWLQQASRKLSRNLRRIAGETTRPKAVRRQVAVEWPPRLVSVGANCGGQERGARRSNPPQSAAFSSWSPPARRWSKAAARGALGCLVVSRSPLAGLQKAVSTEGRIRPTGRSA
jgi:hypothetical protein